MARHFSWLGVLILLAAVSCREPASAELFVPREDCSADGYRFGADLGDSTAVYDLAFYGRLDGRADEMPREAIPLQVTWVSPSLTRFTETVYLAVEGQSPSLFSRQLYAPYREDVAVKEPGWWQLTVSMPDVPALTGLGLRIEKKKADGTR